MKHSGRFWWLCSLVLGAGLFLVAAVQLLHPVSGGGRWCLPGEPLRSFRLVRLGGGVLVGAALALAGMLFQTLFRNPLADSYLLGVSHGSALGAAGFLLWVTAFLPPQWMPLFAFLGGVAALALVLRLSGRDDSPQRLILHGVVVSAILSGILVCLLSQSDVVELAGITWWMLGDLQSVPPEMLPLLGIGTALLAIFTLFWSNGLDALSLGEENARALGVPVSLMRWCLLAGGALLAALCVSTAGILSFVGLIVPHALRQLLGASSRRLLLPVLLGGAAFLTFCDLLSTLSHPVRPIPVGVLTALAGGVFLLAALHRRTQP